MKIQADQVPHLKFTQGDSLAYFQKSPSCIEVLDPNSGFSSSAEIQLKPFDYFVISPFEHNKHFAVVTKHNESNQIKRKGRIRLLKEGSWENLILDQTFQRAYEMELKWSKNNQSVLILAKDFIDDTGKSYYGSNNLSLFNVSPQLRSTIYKRPWG